MTINKKRIEEIDVVILCGGMGNRLAPIINDRPKPMALINQQPFLDILTGYFSRFGFERFVLCAGYKSEVILAHFIHNNSSLEFVISEEKSPLGTAGAIKNAQYLIISNPFLVTNGDSFCTADMTEFLKFHSDREALMSMVVTGTENTESYGSVFLDDSQRIIGFEEKKDIDKHGYINAGIYLFQKEVLPMIPAGMKYSLEYDLFPQLAGRNSHAFITNEKIIDIGTPNRYKQAIEFFNSRVNFFDKGPICANRI